VSTAPVVVITEVGDLDPRPAVRILEDGGFEVVVCTDGLPDPSRGSVSLPARAADAVAAIIGFSPFGADQLALFPDLRLVCTTSTGLDMVDQDAARARGVDVVGLGGVATREVATHALALILAAVRELPVGVRIVRGGGWAVDVPVVPRPIETLTLGLVGFGRIGRELARIARPLFGRVLAFDPAAVEEEHGAQLVDLDSLLTQSDVVSLHLPADDTTRGMFSGARLASLRPGALLVNVSRGELVDDDAVLAALDAGALSGYAADVLDAEPPADDHPLRRHPRAHITPHMAYLSAASLARYEQNPALAIVDRLGHLAVG